MKNQEHVTHSQMKRQSTEANTEETQVLKLLDKHFKATIITMLKDIKEKHLQLIRG